MVFEMMKGGIHYAFIRLQVHTLARAHGTVEVVSVLGEECHELTRRITPPCVGAIPQQDANDSKIIIGLF